VCEPDGRRILGGALELTTVELDRDGRELTSLVSKHLNPLDSADTLLTDPYHGHWRHFPHPMVLQNGRTRVGLIDGCDVRVESMNPGDDSERTGLSHDCPVDKLDYSLDGQQLATVTSDGDLHLWQLSGPTRTFRQHVGPVLDLCFTADGTQVVLSIRGDNMVAVDTATGNQKLIHPTDGIDLYCVEVDVSGRYVAAGGNDGNVVLLDTLADEKMTRFAVPSSVFSLAFTADSRYLAVASSDIRLIDTKTGRLLVTIGHISSPGKRYECIAFSPQSDLLIGAYEYENGWLEIWDLADPWRETGE
jgi:WD40 repeat protein